MKKLLVTLQFFACSLILFAQTGPNISVIPLPVSVVQKTGSFKLRNKSTIELATADADAKRVANFLSIAIATPAGFKIPVTNKMTAGNSIRLVLLKSSDNTLGNEGYKLSVTSNLVIVSANKPAGLYYGVQTILQLLPKEIESK